LEREWSELPESLKKRLCREACWPGIVNGTAYWCEPQDLCIPDAEWMMDLFDDSLKRWPFKEEYPSLAAGVGIRRISEAEANYNAGIPYLRQSPPGNVCARFRRVWVCVYYFVRGSDTERVKTLDPMVPPEISGAPEITVHYRINWHWSRKKQTDAHVDPQGPTVMVSKKCIGSERDLAEATGEALERWLGVGSLREFVKDIWQDLDDMQCLRARLLRWRERVRTFEFEGLLRCLAELEDSEVLEDETEEETGGGNFVGTDGTERPGGPRPPVTEDEDEGGEGTPKDDNNDNDGETHIPVLGRPGHAGGGGSFGGGEPGPPPGPGGRRRPRGPLPLPSAETARRAMEVAIDWWQKRGFEVEDVSGYGMGYDLRVRRGLEVYHVEVKGLQRPGIVHITENEWNVALAKEERYLLMVVVLREQEIGFVRAPGSVLHGSAEACKHTQIIYRVPFAAVAEHLEWEL